jgi:hypothetical protein
MTENTRPEPPSPSDPDEWRALALSFVTELQRPRGPVDMDTVISKQWPAMAALWIDQARTHIAKPASDPWLNAAKAWSLASHYFVSVAKESVRWSQMLRYKDNTGPSQVEEHETTELNRMIEIERRIAAIESELAGKPHDSA